MQRYLAARSADEARSSLLMSAYWKIPLQLLILGAGVLVFVFYLFQAPPMLFGGWNDLGAQQKTKQQWKTLPFASANGPGRSGLRHA